MSADTALPAVVLLAVVVLTGYGIADELRARRSAERKREVNRMGQQARCARGEHRTTVDYIGGALWWSCMDCPHAVRLGYVYYGVSNRATRRAR
jgi:hypothetical protein